MFGICVVGVINALQNFELKQYNNTTLYNNKRNNSRSNALIKKQLLYATFSASLNQGIIYIINNIIILQYYCAFFNNTDYCNIFVIIIIIITIYYIAIYCIYNYFFIYPAGLKKMMMKLLWITNKCKIKCYWCYNKQLPCALICTPSTSKKIIIIKLTTFTSTTRLVLCE